MSLADSWNPKKQAKAVRDAIEKLGPKNPDRSLRHKEATSLSTLDKIEGNLARVADEMRKPGIQLKEASSQGLYPELR